MNFNPKSTGVWSSDKILKKIKNLFVDKEYSYREFGTMNSVSRTYISRLADRGEIVKLANGRFYKPSNRVLVRKATKVIKLDKSLFENDLFWSVSSGFEIKTDTLIKAYLENWSERDLSGLYTLFGYKRLLGDTYKLYKDRNNKNYKNIKKILLKFENWRYSDTSN